MDEKPWWKQAPEPATRRASIGTAEAERPATDADPTTQIAPEAALEAQSISTARVVVLLAFFVVIVIAIIIRLAYWAIAGPPAAPRPSGSPELLRSRIVDSTSLLLATDNFSTEVYARPQGIQVREDRAQLEAKIATALGQPEESIRAGLAVTLTQVTLLKDADPKQRAAIRALKLPGLVWADDVRVRRYPMGQLGAHLVGFTNQQREGRYGVEASYDDWLWGKREMLTSKSAGERIDLPETWRRYLPSPGGHDLVLHMNGALQYLAEKHLAEAIQTYRAESGSIIVMDVRAASILALANYPSYEPDRYLAATQRQWTNQAVSTPYEPGSVFKLITLAAALDTGQITPEKVYQDPGSLVVDGQPIYNAENKKNGTVTVSQVLAKSINVVTARICLDMGPDIFYRYVRQFGFGRLSEVDLSQENPGQVTEPSNPRWSRFDMATNSFGQALTVTPMQMINAVAAIANDGTLFAPQAAQSIVRDGKISSIERRTLGYPIKPETARTMRKLMTYTVDSASYAGFVPGYRVAGKTGTAEISTAKGYTQETITTFVGFLPAADPQIVILVKLDKPKAHRWAEQVAVPVFGKVAIDAVRLLKIAPDNRAP